ncbi:uncharacterized protein ARMOST_06602 [Armillaria ostoyae]|uniref:Uncharacterized protein n=1 Tax=Armillaria ostoyae TaxID=47428 RepID=A0A284R3E3_ARMOS|nr:uncharacterized protein ARMOST_06602 [Armillaria ostoyae]
MAEKMNIPSKIVWSVLRATFSFGYEGLLQHGVDQGWYDPKVPLEALVFRYIFIPWLQQELDKYVIKNNTTKKRHNRKIARPNGVPLLIEQAPERFDAQDYKCAKEFMNELGNPEITQDCVWNIYLALLGKFHDHRIIAVDEWHVFFDDNCYENTQSDANQRQGTLHIDDFNSLVIAELQDKEAEENGGTLSHKGSDKSGEEEYEISGEAPNLEMSLTNFMQHIGV